MKNILIFWFFFAVISTVVNGQVVISTNAAATPAASSMLDIQSTAKGMLVPRMTTAQRTAIASPAAGLLVFDNSLNKFYYFNGSAWTEIGGSTTYTGGTGINVSGTVITNTGDTNAADDITNGMPVGGSLSGVFPNPIIPTASITGNEILNGTVAAADLAADAVTSAKILDGEVATADLAADAVTAAKILDGTISTSDLAANSVTNAKIGSGAATNGQVLTANGSGAANWVTPSGGGGGVQTLIQDADANTKVQTEKNANENIIRFDLNGTESMVLSKSATGSPRLELKTGVQFNTIIGDIAGASLSSGTYNTALGRSALNQTTSGTRNVAIGNGAGEGMQSASENTAVGDNALSGNTSGYANVAMGRNALSANNFGSTNTAVGFFSLLSNNVGNYNTAVGGYALRANTNGKTNTAVGFESLQSNTTGFSNVAIGARSLYKITNASNLVAVGDSALFNNLAGISNTAVGSKALWSNTNGNYSTAVGFNACKLSTSDFNTAFGHNALVNTTSGQDNLGIGQNAMGLNTIGSQNVCVGNSSNVAANNLTNANAFGFSTVVNADNKVRLGNANITVIEGQVDFTFPSDARFKYNVRDNNVPGLTFINKLRPVTYNFDTRSFDNFLMKNTPDSLRQRATNNNNYEKSSARVQTGFLAQDVEQVCNELNYSFSGLHIPESETDNYGLAYGSFVPLLVKSIQEQQLQIEALKNENAQLKTHLNTELAEMKAMIEVLKNR